MLYHLSKDISENKNSVTPQLMKLEKSLIEIKGLASMAAPLSSAKVLVKVPHGRGHVCDYLTL